MLMLITCNILNVRQLWPYLVLGAILWVLLLQSGVHATLAGVLLALTIPIKPSAHGGSTVSPLYRLEHALQKPVAFLIIPVFGFANAGVSFDGVTPAVLTQPLTLGVSTGLVVGKLVGVFGTVVLMVRLGLTGLPEQANWTQTLGVALLCGIGFTMSLFIGLLAFEDPAMQDRVKFGILAGSLIAGIAGYLILRYSPTSTSQTSST